MSGVYMDYNASARVRPEVQDVMAKALAENANPSAVHAAGRRARALVETARGQVAELVGARAEAVVFGSGGTEANAQAVASAQAAGMVRVIVSATEHPCVAEAARASGLPVAVLPVDASGLVQMAVLERLMAEPGPALVAVHHANNESGVIQPIAAVAERVRAAGGWLHVDAVQSAGKIAVDMAELGADSLSLSAHKLGGPQGTGALVMAPGREAVRILHGAGQERGLRAGTENVAAIAGFGVAADCARRDLADQSHHAAWRDAAEAVVQAAGATVIGQTAPRLPNTLFIAVADWPSPQQLISLDLAGIMVSGGSACSSGKTKPSLAISAMGLDDLAGGGLRASGGWATTGDDWSRFADAWVSAYLTHRQRLSARAKEVA